MRNSRKTHARRVLFGVTAGVTARAFLRGQLSYLGEQGWDVQLVYGDSGLAEFARAEGISGLHEINASRNPSLRDPLTVVRLWRLMRLVRPEVVVMGTPKMGVLGILASKAAGVPERVYLLHGYRAEGLRGVLQWILQSMERAACSSATHVVAVSHGVVEKLEQDAIVPSGVIKVLGSGSANGVDLARFQPPTKSEVTAARLMTGVPEDARVLAFVGRLTGDKGLTILPSIWASLAERHPNAWLLVAGSPELSGEADAKRYRELAALPRVRFLGHVDRVESVYHASDALLLLSRREGLPTVVLEAAACEVPTVAWRVTGLSDAVVEGETGLLCPPFDAWYFTDSVSRLLADDATRTRLGERAAARIREEFDQSVVWSRWAGFLESISEPREWRK